MRISILNTACIAGFTLIEMLVSILLLSMISIIGYTGLVFSLEQWQAGENRLSSSLEINRGVSQLRKMLSEPERVSYEKNGTSYRAFKGKHNSIRFVTKVENIRNGGLYVCELSSDRNRNNIILSYGLLHPENGTFDQLKQMNTTDVLHDVKTLRLYYFGSKHGESGKWHKTWQSRDSLPAFIRLEMTDSNNHTRQSLILVETSGV